MKGIYRIIMNNGNYVENCGEYIDFDTEEEAKDAIEYLFGEGYDYEFISKEESETKQDCLKKRQWIRRISR